jgi:hypothetical protein
MTQPIQEYVDSGGEPLRVDRELGVIRGVKLLGLKSRNGRRYLESALAQAVNLYEGAKVNVNHPKGHPLAPRDYQDRIGIIRSVRLRPGEGLFADLHFNPKHNLSEQLAWDAQHAAQNVGLSHNVLAQTNQEGQETVVEAIAKVQSVDLVADPATSRGLFEQIAPAESTHQVDEPPATWEDFSVELVEIHRPDLVEELRRPLLEELQACRQQLEVLSARANGVKRREQILKLLREHNLPDPAETNDTGRELVGQQFMEDLLGAPDEKTVQRLVEERAALVKSASAWSQRRGDTNGRPVSRHQVALGHPETHGQIKSAAEFAAAIRR